MPEKVTQPKRPTLDDVAALAKVSRMVASRAVNASGSVSPAASARVQAAVEMLGYVVHQGARSLATNRTGAVAFLAPLQNARFFSDPNVAQILSGVNEAVRGADLQLVTLIVEDARDAQRAGAYVRGRHVDGVMVLSPELIGDLVRELAGAGTALAANGRVEGATSLDAIVLPTRARAGDMADLLRRSGAREIAIIAGPTENPSTADFLAGVERVIGQVPPGLVEHGAHRYEDGAAAMERLLSRRPQIDGVIVASDVMASAAIAVATEHGRSVPHDVRITGWDDSVPPVPGKPGITTLRIPYRSIGRQMAQMLIEQVDGRQGGREIEIETEIVRRDSA